MRLIVFPDEAALARGAAEELLAAAERAVAAHRRFLIALSGGGTPRSLFRLLADAPFAGRFPWDRTHVFWVDERCVPPDDPGSNFGQAWEILLSRVPLRADQVHRTRGELSPAAAAADYAARLAALAPAGRAWPRLDVALLGMGEDGHTASLFPGQATLEETREPVLAVTAEYGGRPANRVTLSLPVLNDASEAIFLVAGAAKAKMVARVVSGDQGPPAGRVRPRTGALTWLLDAAAAGALSGYGAAAAERAGPE